MSDESENLYLDIDYIGASLFISLSLSDKIIFSDFRTFTNYVNHELDSVDKTSAFLQLDISNIKSISIPATILFFIFNLRYSSRFNKISIIKNNPIPTLLKCAILPMGSSIKYFNDLAEAKSWLNE